MKKLTDQELIVFADEHLKYEIEMLNGTARMLGHYPSGIITNMTVESFSIHLRLLHGFLFNTVKKHPQDAIALDFVDDSDNWKSELKKHTALEAKLKKSNERVGKEIAHLSYGRLRVTPAQKGWDPSIILEINPLLKTFMSMIPPARIPPETKQVIDAL